MQQGQVILIHQDTISSVDLLEKQDMRGSIFNDFKDGSKGRIMFVITHIFCIEIYIHIENMLL